MLIRCGNCTREFEAPKLACEPCGLDATTNPRDADILTELVAIHFDPPTRIKGRGKNHAACDPKLRAGAVRVTSAPTAVTCTACKASKEFTDADGADNGAAPINTSRRK